MNESEKLMNNILNNKDLSFDESKKIFLDIMNGKMKEESIYNFLKNYQCKIF